VTQYYKPINLDKTHNKVWEKHPRTTSI